MIDSTFWRSRPTFVTGSTGLLGSWLVKKLLALDSQVVVLRRNRNARCWLDGEGLVGDLRVIDGDLSDRSLLQRSFIKYRVDTVFHLASQPLVREANLDPAGTMEVNVGGTWNILEAAREAAVSRVIVASSANVYGASTRLPSREEDTATAQNPYAVSKRCAELLASCYATNYRMAVAITRCSNLFGGGDLNFSRIIPGLIRATHRGDRFIIRGDGQSVRDYLYVRDAVLAYLLLAQRLAADLSLSGEIFNFSLESRLSVVELATQVLSLMKRTDIEPIIRNEPSSEIRDQYLSCEKARSRLGWTPAYSLEDGLRETIDWYVAHLEHSIPAVNCEER